MGRILADDFILIGTNGARLTRKDNLLNLVSPNIAITSVNIDSVEVRLLTPVVGVMTAWTSFTLTLDGKKMSGKNCYQDIYMKRENKWVAVAAHVTLLNKQ